MTKSKLLEVFKMYSLIRLYYMRKGIRLGYPETTIVPENQLKQNKMVLEVVVVRNSIFISKLYTQFGEFDFSKEVTLEKNLNNILDLCKLANTFGFDYKKPIGFKVLEVDGETFTAYSYLINSNLNEASLSNLEFKCEGQRVPNASIVDAIITATEEYDFICDYKIDYAIRYISVVISSFIEYYKNNLRLMSKRKGRKKYFRRRLAIPKKRYQVN